MNFWSKLVSKFRAPVDVGPSPTQLPEPTDEQIESLRAALAPWCARNTRRAWKPQVAATSLATKSWFGGSPLMNPGEAWPTCKTCKRPMYFLLQLELKTLPNRAQQAVNGEFLQLFYCSTDDGNCETWSAFSGTHVARIARGDLVQAALPSGLPMLPQKYIFGWEELADLPHTEDHGALGLNCSYDFTAKTISIELTEPPARFGPLSSELELETLTDEPASGDKLGGWPLWIQGNEIPTCPICAAEMEFVFQIDSNANLPIIFGDAGIGHITQCPHHADVLTFAWACS